MKTRLGRRSAAWSALVAAMLAAAVPATAQSTASFVNPTQVNNPDNGVPPAQLPGTMALPTGKVITPVAQAVPNTNPQPVGSLPANMVLTPDGKFALVTDIGFREYLTCLSTATGQIANPLTVPPFDTSGNTVDPPTSASLIAFGVPYDGSSASYGTPGLYYGLAIAPTKNADGSYTAYAAEGTNGEIAVITISSTGALTQTGQINMQNADNPAGISLDDHGLLYVANNVNAGTANSEALTPGSLVVYNTKASNVIAPVSSSGTQTAAPEVARITLNTRAFGTYRVPSNNTFRPHPPLPFTPTSFPYAVQALPDGSKVYVSSQRDGLVYSVNTATKAVTPIPTGATTANSHPIAFLLTGTTLYVANAQDDSVSVINTATDTVSKTISLTSLLPAGTPPGATPNGLALSPDGATLYVTLGDMNAVAVVDTATAAVTGYVPVGWYPTGIAAVSGNTTGAVNLLVANAKGTSQANPNPGHVVHNPPPGSSTKYTHTTSSTNPYPNLSDPYVSANDTYDDTFYDENVLEGDVQDIAAPDAATLASLTQTVIANNTNPIDSGAKSLAALGIGTNGSGKIKHVIYIIKENRTYDQVLGDVTAGNGDPSLAIFGSKVTPNLHALAQNYVLLDNFYDCSEVSGDGWNWSTQSYANEYVIKNVPNNYSYRRASYDFEGQVNNMLAGGVPQSDFSSPAFPSGTPAFPDVDTGAGGYIWDTAEKAGLTFRDYGVLINSGVGGLSPDNYPSETGLKPGDHYAGGTSYGHTDLDFREFDLSYPDSDAPVGGGGDPYPEKTYGRFNAPDRFAEWNREFQLMLKAAPDGAAVPNLMTIKFMSDHTNGFSVGGVTPVGHVADNDYAVGELVQAVSNSPIWDSTAIFVIEDDAQDGPDHVDCHRSTAYVISPYVKPATHDSGFHNTDSVLHSIELLLGLPPLTQYDAYAPSFGSDFAATVQNNAAYAVTPEVSSLVTQVRTASWFKAHPEYMKLVAMTRTMDFRKEDRAPAQMLNQVIWQSVHGMNSAMPAPRHGVIAVKAVKGTVRGAKTAARDGDD